MAAVTPATTRRFSLGSIAMVQASFAATLDNADTWTSGLKGIVGYIAQGITQPTQTKEGVNVVNASGVFTFYLGEDNKAVDLFVFLRS